MFELFVILSLVLVNALLSGSEMAVVSARRAKLQAAADAGSGNAATVLQLRNDPERFLATVQVGITLVGAIAGAFGGASLTAVVTPWLAGIPGFATIAPSLAFGLVVGLITYLSVVFGELIPKSLALRHAEKIAMVMARPIMVLEWLARPLIWILVKSSNLVLRPFHDSTNFVESKLLRDDLEAMIDQATDQSDLSSDTRDVLSRAIDFSDLHAIDVMVPRRWVVALPITADEAALRNALLEVGHRRVPIYDGSLDEMQGYVLREDVMVRLWDRQPLDLATLMRKAYYVPETMPAATLLREMQLRRLQLAIVIEEMGGVSGIVTIEDLLEELVGEIFHERDAATVAEWTREPDGAWMVPGQFGIRDFCRAADVEIEAPEDVRTLSGLMVHLADGHIPPQGTVQTTESGLQLEAVEVSPRRVRLVRVRTLPA